MRMTRVGQLGAIVPPRPGKACTCPGRIITYPAVATINVADVPLLPGGGVLSIVWSTVKGDNPIDGLRLAIAISLNFLGIWIVPWLIDFVCKN